MKHKYVKNNYWFVLISIILMLPMLLFTGWLPDDTMWVLGLFKYKPFFFLTSAFDGAGDRFQPTHQLMNQILSFFTTSPFVYHLYGFLIALFSLYILFLIVKKISPLFSFAPLAIIFTSAFSAHFYTIHTSKELFILWSFFIYIFYLIIKGDKISKLKLLCLILLCVFAVFMKEINFIASATFVLALCVLNMRPISNKLYGDNKKIKLTFKAKLSLSAIFVISLAFLLCYLNFVSFSKESSYLNSLTPDWSFGGRLIFSLKSLFLYTISDPLIVIVLPILFLDSVIGRLRNREVYFKEATNEKYFIFFDACTLTAMSFLASYVLLGFHGNRYLLSSYPFAIIPIAGYAEVLVKKNCRPITFSYKLIVVIVMSIFVVNGAISCFNTVSFTKTLSYNFMAYSKTLVTQINNLKNHKPLYTKISFCIANTTNGCYLYDRHIDMMTFYGVDKSILEYVCRDRKDNDQKNHKMYYSKKCDVLNNDLILVTPNGSLPQKLVLNRLEGLSAKNIFKTKSPRFIELPEIRRVLKKMVLKYEPSAVRSRMVNREVDFMIYTTKEDLH